METRLSKATKNNDSTRGNWSFFDKWRWVVFDVLSTHVDHQNLNITRIHAANSTCLANSDWSDFFKLLHGFYRECWHFIIIKTIRYHLVLMQTSFPRFLFLSLYIFHTSPGSLLALNNQDHCLVVFRSMKPSGPLIVVN